MLRSFHKQNPKAKAKRFLRPIVQEKYFSRWIFFKTPDKIKHQNVFTPHFVGCPLLEDDGAVFTKLKKHLNINKNKLITSFTKAKDR